jgi:hypothetical protein
MPAPDSRRSGPPRLPEKALRIGHDGCAGMAYIDPVVKERASVVLESIGLTISDAVRILLTRTANEESQPTRKRARVITTLDQSTQSP